MGKGGFPATDVPPAYPLNLLNESSPFQHLTLGVSNENIMTITQDALSTLHVQRQSGLSMRISPSLLYYLHRKL